MSEFEDKVEEKLKFIGERVEGLCMIISVLYDEFEKSACSCVWIQDEKFTCSKHEALRNPEIIKVMEELKEFIK